MNWPLFILALLGLGAALGFGLWLRLRQWDRRWETRATLLFDSNDVKIRCDFAYRWNAYEIAELTSGVFAANDVLPRTRFWVEVVEPGKVSTPTVPTGVLKDGRVAQASMRAERLFPWTRKVWVAVVSSKKAGELVVHEVTRHIESMDRGWGLDLSHRNEELAKLEHEAMRRYREERP